MRILTTKEVCALLRYSRTHLTRMENQGKFISRVQIGPGRVGYYEHEVRAWLASRPRVSKRKPDDSGQPQSPSP
ncbi:unnamed protein product [Phaeothamnion confervicola]